MDGELTNSAGPNRLFIAGSNDQYLAQIEQAVHSFYEPQSFTDSHELMDVLYSKTPSALVLDSALPGMPGVDVISKIRGLIGGDAMPIIFTIAAGRQDVIEAANKFPGVVCLEKPYKRSDLLNVIADQINGFVEAKWEKIEPVQRNALKKTLGSFTAIADTLINGEELDYGVVKDNCVDLVRAVQSNNFKEILQGVKEHHNYTYAHSMRVATLLSLFGDAIGITGEDHMTLTTGGLLHDVGKMSIPHEILNKKGKLDDEERLLMNDHVLFTTQFLERSTTVPKGAMVIAGQHHEKLDGTGYPNGFAGPQVNKLARMACIIDIFSALTDERSYKAAMSPEKAFGIMEDMGGYHLDKLLLKTFKDMLLSGVLH
ncbi:MAG: HD domain-containing protein [Rhodospirillales bacterium]|jgi:putative nucleotidyltransferase with HDIG domain|nr:HD domain-containing protein [Rhodospirillales bacterium]